MSHDFNFLYILKICYIASCAPPTPAYLVGTDITPPALAALSYFRRLQLSPAGLQPRCLSMKCDSNRKALKVCRLLPEQYVALEENRLYIYQRFCYSVRHPYVPCRYLFFFLLLAFLGRRRLVDHSWEVR